MSSQETLTTFSEFVNHKGFLISLYLSSRIYLLIKFLFVPDYFILYFIYNVLRCRENDLLQMSKKVLCRG